METDSNGDSWKIYRRYIIAEIERLSTNQGILDKKLSDYILTTAVDISRLKIYAAIVGALSGGIVSLLAREVIRRW
jgi:hypothetical protein